MSGCKWLSGVKRVSGGKTLKIDIRICGDVIEDIVLSGDFFAHPEELVDELENSLKGLKASKAVDVINSFRDKIEFTGITIDDVIDLINKLLMRTV